MNICMLLSKSWSGLCCEFSSMTKLAAAFCHENLVWWGFFWFKSKIHSISCLMFRARLKETSKFSVDQFVVWVYPRLFQCFLALETVCMSGSDSTVLCGCRSSVLSVSLISDQNFLNLRLNPSLCHCQCSWSLLSKGEKDSYKFHFLWAFLA